MPIIQRFISIYKLWDEFRDHFPKKSRYTLGAKIDSLFIEKIEFLYIAGSLPRGQKLPVLQKASGKLDLLKFFLQLAWELKLFDNKKYIILSDPLADIGRMIGGWIKNVEKETSATER